VTVRWLTAFLDFPAPAFGTACAFWMAVTASTLSPPRGPDAEFATLLPSDGDACLRVQRTGSRRPGCHLDLHADDIAGTAERARQLGARQLREEPGTVMLSSPGGLEFCVTGQHGEASRPAPVRWPGGHRSLADQLCLDIPPHRYERECAFWAALTGWRRRTGSRPEFEYLVRPPGIPLRLLLQRLDTAQPDRCTAHPDLACDDVAAERQRHEALGATVLAVMPDWTTLRDPGGLCYCITRRNPDTGML
jgi:hypothetical protein